MSWTQLITIAKEIPGLTLGWTVISSGFQKTSVLQPVTLILIFS